MGGFGAFAQGIGRVASDINAGQNELAQRKMQQQQLDLQKSQLGLEQIKQQMAQQQWKMQSDPNSVRQYLAGLYRRDPTDQEINDYIEGRSTVPREETLDAFRARMAEQLVKGGMDPQKALQAVQAESSGFIKAVPDETGQSSTGMHWKNMLTGQDLGEAPNPIRDRHIARMQEIRAQGEERLQQIAAAARNNPKIWTAVKSSPLWTASEQKMKQAITTIQNDYNKLSFGKDPVTGKGWTDQDVANIETEVQESQRQEDEAYTELSNMYANALAGLLPGQTAPGQGGEGDQTQTNPSMPSNPTYTPPSQSPNAPIPGSSFTPRYGPGAKVIAPGVTQPANTRLVR